MKTYLRRLWAALCGREHRPLEWGSPISFRSPGGRLVHAEVTSVTYNQSMDEPDRLVIEARAMIHRIQRGQP